MREVYSKAWSVAVWRGDESDESNEAIDFISGFAHLSPSSPSEFTQWKWGRSMMKNVRWGPLMSLFQRPYWQRVWIIQELSMNSNLTIFICGDRAFYRRVGTHYSTLHLWTYDDKKIAVSDRNITV
jgi:hypothetical protein